MKKKQDKGGQVDYQHLFQRTLADFENYKKRTDQEKAQWTAQAKIDFLCKLLPVLDNLALMANHQPKELKDNSWAQGVGLIAKQIETTLLEEEVEKIEPMPGDDFDPNFHEAISTKKSQELPPGKIVSVPKPGYKIADKIIRVAQVITSA